MAGERLVEAVEGGQDVAAVVAGLGVVGADRQCAIATRQRFVETAEFAECVGAYVEGVEVIRRNRDDLAIEALGVCKITLPMQSDRAPHPGGSQRVADAVDHAVPVAGGILAKQAGGWIPGAVLAVKQPAPVDTDGG